MVLTSLWDPFSIEVVFGPSKGLGDQNHLKSPLFLCSWILGPLQMRLRTKIGQFSRPGCPLTACQALSMVPSTPLGASTPTPARNGSHKRFHSCWGSSRVWQGSWRPLFCHNLGHPRGVRSTTCQPHTNIHVLAVTSISFQKKRGV